MKRILLFVPITLFAGLAAYMFFGLTRIDTTVLPSVMINKPVPTFNLPAVNTEIPPLASADLKGQVSLINVFGSWCIACQYEHDFLMNLQASGIIPVYGIDWRDTPEQGAAWLARYGNPYDAVGVDEIGQTVIDFGVTGAPETFIIDKEGRIRWRHVGPLNQEVWDKELWPLIIELREETGTAGLVGNADF
ncbi:MAG: DsbE family thiol:disulfide interchange protein [Aquisalinus sp.]|nr:DsbE family thiol:disulfide interchange protein [Aquisalinus sp.]